MIYNSMTELIGKTPIVSLARLSEHHGLLTPIAAKLECMNPAGSVKDRVALSMILDAERNGTIHPGATIIEPTSGNTGIGLAAVAAARGYRVILTMPDTMSEERRALAAAYGAHVVLTPGKDGMAGAVQKADQLARDTPGAIVAGQFYNPANPAAHFASTGPELWCDTDGKLDIFVAGIGTGGTITGTGEYLHSKNPRIKTVGVEPAESPLITAGSAGPHRIQGIGANFIPSVLNMRAVDEMMAVKSGDAIATAQEIASLEGLLVGISSGCAAFAAIQLAKRPENAGKLIVALLPDTGERYLSSPGFIAR